MEEKLLGEILEAVKIRKVFFLEELEIDIYG